MWVARLIAKICCIVLNTMFFVVGIMFLVTAMNRDLSGVIESIIMGIVVFFARVRLGHFLLETDGNTYRYEGVFARYYKGYYVDLFTLIVTILFAGLMIFVGVYSEWWME